MAKHGIKEQQGSLVCRGTWVFSCRSAGCAGINDIWDRDFDKHVRGTP